MHSGTSEDEVVYLKEALHSHQQLLQQVQSELEVEREAAESAASEALSMILRLQAEKAALKLEANQYKRVAEERMSHVEEAQFFLEDLIYEKEMEIASLEFQIQAYRRKLRSLGCNDISAIETRLPESLLNLRRSSSNGDAGDASPRPPPLARRNSLPVLNLMDDFQKKSDMESQRSSTVLPDLGRWKDEEMAEKEDEEKLNDVDKKSEDSVNMDMNTYWNQIKKKDQKVKDRSDCKESPKPKFAKTRNRSGLPPLQQAVNARLCDRAVESSFHDGSCSSSTVHDVFEVPQVGNSHQTKGESETLDSEHIAQGSPDLRMGKPDSELQESSDLHAHEHEHERLRKKLHLLCASRSPNSKGMRNERMSGHQRVSLTADSSCADFQQLMHRVERLEGTRNVRMPEFDTEGNLQVELLREIREQLDSIQSELRSWRSRVQPRRAQPTSGIEEVCLHLCFLSSFPQFYVFFQINHTLIVYPFI